MTAFLRLEAYDAGQTGVTLVDSSVALPANPTVLVDPDWGNAEWETQFSGPRGTLGARAGSRTIKNRVVQLPFKIYGASKQDLAARMSDLHAVVDLLRRFGGRIIRRAHLQTYRQYLEVLATPGLQLVEWGTRGEFRDLAKVMLTATCAPYAAGDSMEVNDTFRRDTLNGGWSADYTADAGVVTNLGVAGHAAAATANVATENRLIHTATGYTYGDVQVTVKATPGATITSFKAGVILKRIDASNYLEVYVDDTGAVSRLRVDKVVATVRTNLSSTNLAARITAGSTFVVRGRVEGTMVYAEHFTSTTAPYTALGAATTAAAYAMTTADQIIFGLAIEGRCGLVFTPQTVGATVDDFEVWPFVYRGDLTTTSWRTPDEFELHGQVPGDVAALMEVELQSPLAWLGLGWYRRPGVSNMAWNGAFEDVNAGVAPLGWAVTAVTNVNAAATSILRTASAFKYGPPFGNTAGGAGEITTILGNADSGAQTRLFRSFRRNRTYIAFAWVQSAASVQNVAVRLGNGATPDVATGSNVALATTWKLATVTWTPTADRADAHFSVIRRTAGAADVFRVDGVNVIEGRPAFLSAAISSTTATTATVYTYPPDWPDPAVEPFHVLIGSELVLVTARSGLTLTIARGREGTTAATATIDTAIYPLPISRYQLEGFGARPPYGVVEAEGEYLQGLTATSTAGTRSGFDARASAGSSVSTGTFIDTRLVEPDEGTDDEVGFLAITRALSSGDNAKATLFASVGAEQESGANALGISVYYPTVYPIEYGSPGKGIRDPAAANNGLFLPFKVGTWRLRRSGIRQRLQVGQSSQGAAFTQPVGFDYHVLLPANQTAMHPTGKQFSVNPGGIAVPTIGWRFTPDLSARAWYPPQREATPLTGLGGALLEVPAGNVNLVVYGIYPSAPDSPITDGTDTTGDSGNATIATVSRFTFTPRWAILRD